jgi:hypothetical protein
LLSSFGHTSVVINTIPLILESIETFVFYFPSAPTTLDQHEGKITDGVLAEVSILCSDLKKMGDILGLLTQEPEEYFRVKKESGLADKALDADTMNIMLEDGPD